MNKPKMIVFDYGDTLVKEPSIDFLRGYQKLIDLSEVNPDALDGPALKNIADRLYGFLESLQNERNLESSCTSYFRLLFDYCGLRSKDSFSELEREFCFAVYRLAPVAGAKTLFDFLKKEGIRCGVLSNTLFSGGALTALIQSVLPDFSADFVMTSADYILRKPEKILFETMLKKTGLPSQNVWFVGDKPHRDVAGAKTVGLQAFLLDEGERYTDVPDCVKIKTLDTLVGLIQKAD